MFVLPKPRVQSVWIDNVLGITYIVQGIKRDLAMVTCRHGQRQWEDALPLECFATELKEVI